MFKKSYEMSIQKLSTLMIDGLPFKFEEDPRINYYFIMEQDEVIRVRLTYPSGTVEERYVEQDGGFMIAGTLVE